MAKPWHVFTTGKHTDNKNRNWEFGRGDLENIARTIVGRPVQIGHENGIVKTEVADAAVVGDHLVVVPKDIPADLAEQVAGFGLSLQLFQPDHPNNPTPGQWAADHLAFVQSPKIKDLLQPAFGDDGVVLSFEPIAFGEELALIVKLMRRMREFVLAQAGAEEAERLFPLAEMEELAERAAYDKAEQMLDRLAAYGERKKTDPKDLEIARLKAQLTEIQNRQWLEKVAFGAEGFRLPPHLKDTTLKLMEMLGQIPEPVQFGDGSKPALDLFKSFIEGLPLAVTFGEEVSKPEPEPEPVAFGLPPGYQVDPQKLALYQKAKRYQAEHPGVDLKTAYLAVGGA